MPDATAELDRIIAGLDAAVVEGLDKAAEAVARVAASGTKGNLAKSIIVRRGGKFTRLVTTDLPYAEFVENGHPGFSAAPRKMLRFEIAGRVVFCKSVGPTKAVHYMESARRYADSLASEYVQIAVDRLVR